MGRIDEALRRTGGNQPAEEQTRAVANPNVFESPWSFDETGTHRAVTPAAPETSGPPAEIPPRVPAARPTGDTIINPDAQMAVFRGFRKDFMDRLVIGSTIT